MDAFLPFIQDHAQYAHWVIFGLFMLAGLNFPISEDLLIIISGVLAATLVPENTWKLFTAVFLGAYLSDWVVYWIGRLLGSNLEKVRWFAAPEKIDKIKAYYKKYGIMTLLVGRFIPFGVRNCLFLTAGLGRMPFVKFMICDGIACILSNTFLFVLSFYCGKSCSSWVKLINVGIFSLFIIAVIGIIWYKKGKTVRSTK